MNNYTRDNRNDNADIIKTCKKIVITGGVGVGKTTTINHIKRLLDGVNIKYINVPEYIDGDKHNGKRMLEDYLNKRMSAFDFQYYILNYYDRYLNSLHIDENTIMLFERLPDDSITCFANRENKKGLLKDSELYTLYTYASDINEFYGIPSYFTLRDDKNVNISIIKSDNSHNIAEQIINKCLSLEYNLFVVCLYNTPEECLRRIHKRGIQSEINCYDINTVKEFNIHYTNLYSLFMNNEFLRFCDIGKLLI